MKIQNFSELHIGDIFTTQKELNKPATQTLWRKRSRRTAELTSGSEIDISDVYKATIGRPRWFYFRKTETVFKQGEHDGQA